MKIVKGVVKTGMSYGVAVDGELLLYGMIIREALHVIEQNPDFYLMTVLKDSMSNITFERVHEWKYNEFRKYYDEHRSSVETAV